MKVIQLSSNIKPNALKVAMGYRCITQTELCKNINGLSQPNLSRFLNGYYGCLSVEKLKIIMEFLNFPFEFIYQDFKPLKTSKGILR